MKKIEELLLIAKKQHSKEARMKLLNALLKAPLKIPAINLKGDSSLKKKWEVITDDEKGRIKIIKDSKGGDSIPAFTGDDHLRQWIPQGSYYLAFYGTDLFRICTLNNLNGIIVNPGGDLALEIPKDEVKAISDRN
jgi:hypothetical protein